LRPQRKGAASVGAETTLTSSREHQSHPKPRAVVDGTTKRPHANNLASNTLAFWRPFARVVATAVLVACIAGALIIPTAVVGFGVWMSDTHPLWFPVYLVAILTIVIGFLVGEVRR
jgi:ABC-type multidrug transport system permease subunit